MNERKSNRKYQLIYFLTYLDEYHYEPKKRLKEDLVRMFKLKRDGEDIIYYCIQNHLIQYSLSAERISGKDYLTLTLEGSDHIDRLKRNKRDVESHKTTKLVAVFTFILALGVGLEALSSFPEGIISNSIMNIYLVTISLFILSGILISGYEFYRSFF
ncbi:MAG: hypothetical protein IH845_05505 [Nanoarchaeota archaeon]|nr:hypothetical protein [Nanoarchaeota archaeon]